MKSIINKTTFRRLFVCSCRPSSSSSSSSSSSLPAIKTVTDASLNAQKPSVIGSIEQPPILTGEPQKVSKDELGSDLFRPIFPNPPNPELCCGSGCPNCIWIQYAEEVINYVKRIPLHDGIEERQKKMVRDALDQNVEDDNLRVYLRMEIQAKGF